MSQRGTVNGYVLALITAVRVLPGRSGSCFGLSDAVLISSERIKDARN